jgi:ABC-type multidrug transport system ATPase subunit
VHALCPPLPACVGKSSLVNCLTGLLEPTFGNAWINGAPIANVHRIQKHMGVCMQDDILFEDLSVRETLRVFAAIRGIPLMDIPSTVISKLRQFHMDSYADQPVRTLSGGQKRRVSLFLATLGDPTICMLDEPTTGMDPVNRNYIWSAIKELKRGRIVVLTTHNMEEADYLGDTIALMSGGRIRYDAMRWARRSSSRIGTAAGTSCRCSYTRTSRRRCSKQ